MDAFGSDSKSNGNRWWEFYFVRYFVGTVVGGAILLYLNASETSSLHNLIIPGAGDASKLDAHLLTLLAAMGLAYCYVASAPVLVLHATRGVFLAKDSRLYQWFFAGSLLLVAAGASGFYAYQAEPDTRTILSGVLLAIVLCMQVVPLAFAIRKDGACVHAYYAGLANARSRDTAAARQYVESYRHLREHGNAFFILLFELTLGTILASAAKPHVALIALLLWTMPAGMVWMIGTVLEHRFASDPWES